MPAMAALPEGIVAFLLTDLEGSTRLWEDRPGAMRKAMVMHDAIIGAAVQRHGGSLVEVGREGDSILAVFRKTAGAAGCALEIQREIAAAVWPPEVTLRLRIAIHAGEAQLRGGHYFGQALNRCARMLATSHGGQIVLSKAAHELVVDELPAGSELWDLGLHRLKDLKRPEQIFQLVDLHRPAQFPPIRSLPRHLSNLPIQLTTFVGRQEELRKLKHLQAGTRLLTLAGPGGSGKTRLAEEFAGELIDAHPDGIWFVDLAPVVDEGLVPRAVIAGLELQEQAGRTPLETVVEHCRDKKLLVLLDNCEHLVTACARLALQLLSDCADLRLIVTSREPLNVPGETVWRVPPLSVAEATRLFLDRAHASAPGVVLDDSGVATVTRICRRLDGIPLAMELAAARVPMMPVDEILQRLETGLAFLAGGSRTASTRQRTLQATIDWSHDLLEVPEQVLFRRAAVFAGNFSLIACEQVCTDSGLPQPDVVDLVGQLVSKSLVLAVDGRYRCLDTIREYALDRLEAAEEVDRTQARHADFYLQVAASRQPGHLAAWLNRLEEDHDNLLAALRWAADSNVELGLKLANELYAFWLLRGHIAEARQSLEQMLDRVSEASPLLRAGLLDAGTFAYVAGDFDASERRIRDGLARSEKAGDRTGTARALFLSGLLDSARGRIEAAQASLQEALRISREAGNQQQEGEVLHQLGMVASQRGDVAGAESLLKQSIEVRSANGRRDESGMSMVFLAAVSMAQGNMPTARESIREALEIGLSQRDRRSAWSLDMLACISALDGSAERALRLAGAASAMFESTGQKPPPLWHQFTAGFQDAARHELPADRSRAAWDAGHALGFEEALTYALEAFSS
jgi:predicted ATPase/class 3 adenylate cyclase